LQAYFPAKPGFQSAVTTLQSLGVRVAPYINGRIFDVHSPLWSSQHASLAAAKQCPAQVNSQQLSLYEESYGSGATFAVMCPHTQVKYRFFCSCVVLCASEKGLF
jgi:hypothetical protein